jgi:hypothetical protein
MKCPNCGTPGLEKVVKKCRVCGEAFASEDLLELYQLEYLVERTRGWPGVATYRNSYVNRLKTLRERLRRGAPMEEPAVEPTPAVSEKAAAAPARMVSANAASTSASASVSAPEPAKESVPFDQWLLSERNIKIALYIGGFLLFIAGAIFVGVNWGRIPGPAKFAITLMITGLTYLGGFVLFQSEAYRIAGVALLGLASGFLALNFAVLQHYVVGPAGLRDDVMWLIASPICFCAYVITARWTKADLFIYISIGAVGSTLAAALKVFDAHITFTPLASGLLLTLIMLLSYRAKSSSTASYTYDPLRYVSQIGMPLAIVFALALWSDYSGCSRCAPIVPWLPVICVAVGALFYAISNMLYKWIAARWAAAVLVLVTTYLILVELNASDIAMAATLMILALAYMGIGYRLEQAEGLRAAGWPLYAAAYAVALVVTLSAAGNELDLAIVLFVDVVILAISAVVHRDFRWVYGAVWLFILPVWLLLAWYVGDESDSGLIMGLLGLNYTVIGYALGRRQLRHGMPFLSAAALLSIISAVLTYETPVINSIALAVIAVVYFLVALWLEVPWLLYPMLLALNLCLHAAHNAIYDWKTPTQVFEISYAALGVVLVMVGYALRRRDHEGWGWPLYIVASLDLLAAYGTAMVDDYYMAIGMSLVSSILLLTFAWLERSEFQKRKLPHLLTYLGLLVVFIGHFFLLEELNVDYDQVGPMYTAGVCLLFVGVAWLLRSEESVKIYADPLRRTGLGLMLIPVAASIWIAVYDYEPIIAAATFAIAGVTYSADAARRKSVYQAYVGGMSFLLVLWSVLMAFEVDEPQAYILPLGLALLFGGWNERRRGKQTTYNRVTRLGLILLLGSTFLQSLPRGAIGYTLLLAIESVVAIVWGVRKRSRNYVRYGSIAFLANVIVQLGAGFVDLSRWVQIGLTGGILFGGGLLALSKREQLLATRERFTKTWREWEE